MRIEILTEDKSGSVVIEKLVRQICLAEGIDADLYVRPHRGCGSLPMDWSERPHKFASALLELLPAKCRAYNAALKGTDSVLIVVMDSDDHDPEELKKQLGLVCRKFAPDIKSVIGLCVEEVESWILGDRQAIEKAYPYYDKKALDEYKQDSVCGTWEALCKVVCPDTYERIIDIGYPAIGEYKARWSKAVSRYMLPENNISPSFKSFRKTFIYSVKLDKEPVKRPKVHTRTF
ncbi:MAG: DUF4276 family protein [Clostridia bacterium]|nr:DUF4276 family protein [Clostridia bacterium]